MKNGLKIFAGIIVALALAELGLRLYFSQYEAVGSYTGRNTNVADAELGFHFSPNSSMPSGREDKIPEIIIRTNKYGFRDMKDYKRAASGEKIAVYGASYMFGIGIQRHEDMFYRRLEAELQQNYNWDAGLDVYNFSSLGFVINQIVELANRTVDDLQPDIVLVVTRPLNRIFDPDSVDLVDGINFPADRFAAGSAFDLLRTRNYCFMRSVRSPLLKNPLKKFLKKRDPEQLRQAWEQTHLKQVQLLLELKQKLDKRGVIMGVVLVNERNEDLIFHLNSAGLPNVYIELDKSCKFTGDNHWNAAGHAQAAKIVAAFTDKLKAGGQGGGN